MKKTVALKRSAIVDLIEVFEACGGVKPTEAESADGRLRMAVQTFKWRVSRNQQACQIAAAKFQRDMIAAQDSLVDPDDREAYMTAQEALVEEHAAKNADGFVVRDPNGNVNIPVERRKDLEAAIKALRLQHPAVVEWSQKRDEAAELFMQDVVEIGLLTVKWNHLPAGLHGGYLTALEPMIDGAPMTETEPS